MKLTLEDNPRLNRIRSYSNTEVRVSDQVLSRSCIIAPDMVMPDWRPSSVSDLRESDLEVLLSTKPDLVLLGTGATHAFAPAPIRGALVKKGIALETMDLGAACRTFNILVQEERRVCAALLFEPSS
jgi:uncharacterized protein